MSERDETRQAPDDPLTIGPPSPWLSARHVRLRRELLEWRDRHRAALEGPGHETLTDDRTVHGLLTEAPFWSELLAGLGADASGVGTRDLTAVAQARELLAATSARADTLLGVQGLVIAALEASLAVQAEDEAASTYETAVATTRLRDDVRAGRAIGAFALTEPEAGSDLSALSTEALTRGDDFVLRGHKTFVSCAGLASHALVLARTSPTGVRGLSLLLVPMKSPGIQLRPLSVMAPHDIAEVTFAEVVLPASALLGRRDEGFALAREALTLMRPTVGASALGLAGRALREARAFLSHRVAFGQKLSENAALRARLADHLTALEAARLLVYRATWLADAADPPSTAEIARASSMAKLFATETAQTIVDDALQMHGGQGVLAGGVMERLYREVRALRLYEGTSEIQRAILARCFFGPAGS